MSQEDPHEIIVLVTGEYSPGYAIVEAHRARLDAQAGPVAETPAEIKAQGGRKARRKQKLWDRAHGKEQQ